MTIRKDILERILKELRQARLKPPCGLTITELSKRIGLSRTVIIIHLVALETKGLVGSVRVQNASLYFIKEKKE